MNCMYTALQGRNIHYFINILDFGHTAWIIPISTGNILETPIGYTSFQIYEKTIRKIVFSKLLSRFCLLALQKIDYYLIERASHLI